MIPPIHTNSQPIPDPLEEVRADRAARRDGALFLNEFQLFFARMPQVPAPAASTAADAPLAQLAVTDVPLHPELAVLADVSRSLSTELPHIGATTAANRGLIARLESVPGLLRALSIPFVPTDDLARVPDPKKAARDVVDALGNETKLFDSLGRFGVTKEVLLDILDKKSPKILFLDDLTSLSKRDAAAEGFFTRRGGNVTVLHDRPTCEETIKSLLLRGALPNAMQTTVHELTHRFQYPPSKFDWLASRTGSFLMGLGISAASMGILTDLLGASLWVSGPVGALLSAGIVGIRYLKYRHSLFAIEAQAWLSEAFTPSSKGLFTDLIHLRFSGWNGGDSQFSLNSTAQTLADSYGRGDRDLDRARNAVRVMADLFLLGVPQREIAQLAVRAKQNRSTGHYDSLVARADRAWSEFGITSGSPEQATLRSALTLCCLVEDLWLRRSVAEVTEKTLRRISAESVDAGQNSAR